jgi:hypothetical protein
MDKYNLDKVKADKYSQITFVKECMINEQMAKVDIVQFTRNCNEGSYLKMLLKCQGMIKKLNSKYENPPNRIVSEEIKTSINNLGMYLHNEDPFIIVKVVYNVDDEDYIKEKAQIFCRNRFEWFMNLDEICKTKIIEKSIEKYK